MTASSIGDQLQALFEAWGMAADQALTTATLMLETDLRGVDSHGVAMLPSYDTEFRKGRLNMRPTFRIVRENASTAVIDADASMGHPVSVMAMDLAVDKALAAGVAVVAVRNSHHFGAAGCYSRRAADRGVIGIATTSARGILMVPTFAAEPVLGTNPLAFAAPASRNRPFELDMATTTVAGGKVKSYKLRHRPLPAGWVVDGAGRTITDPAEAVAQLYDRPDGGITPLGGDRASGGHKGYGLAVMVQILSAALSGAAFSPIHSKTQGPSDPHDIGHCFIAIDPDAFREAGAFEADVDTIVDVLHDTRPADPSQPVLVAGDPEEAARVERLRSGIPVPDDLLADVRAIVERAGAPFLLREVGDVTGA
jgi:LDH2 family malate/lactate/ureidoglycolate dehydrogenase